MKNCYTIWNNNNDNIEMYMQMCIIYKNNISVLNSKTLNSSSNVFESPSPYNFISPSSSKLFDISPSSSNLDDISPSSSNLDDISPSSKKLDDRSPSSSKITGTVPSNSMITDISSPSPNFRGSMPPPISPSFSNSSKLIDDIGVTIGVSILSVLTFFSFIILIIFKYKKRRKNKVQNIVNPNNFKIVERPKDFMLEYLDK